METNPSPSNPPQKRFPVGLIAGILLLAVLFMIGILPKLRAQSQLVAEAKDASQEAPGVQLAEPHLASDQDLVLPGNIQAITETAVQARTSGYVTRLYVDIGSHVKKGQVLADIESPDVDQQVAQAHADTAKSRATVGQSMADVARLGAGVEQSRADVARAQAAVKQARAQQSSAQSKFIQAQAGQTEAEAKLKQSQAAVKVQQANLAQTEAQYELAEATEKRYRKLLADGFIAQQDYDQAAATYKTSVANKAAAEANIQAAESDVQAAEGTVRSNAALVQAAESDLDAAKENVRASQASLQATVTSVDAARASVNAGRASVEANQAQVNSSLANEHKFEVERGFEHVVAPFDGVITSRNVDVGSLVTPGTTNEVNASTTTPVIGLFGLARTDTVRVRVNIPQTYYQAAAAGSKVEVTVRELPNKVFHGEIAESAGAIDTSSRTLLTEIHLANPEGFLLSGMYAQVRLMPSHAQSTLRIPANTLIFDASGTHVAVVTPDNVMHMRTIKEGRDFGQEIEVLSGVTENDRLITNPTDDLHDGEKVTPQEAPAK